MSQLVKDLDLKAFHNMVVRNNVAAVVSQLVKDLDLKAFHNGYMGDPDRQGVSQLVKDLDLKAFHNCCALRGARANGVTARQRS